MSDAIRLAKARERERILGGAQRRRAIAKYPDGAGDRGERLRLMLEARAIDKANGIVRFRQRLDGAGKLAGLESIRQSAVELYAGETRLSRIVIAKNVNRQRSESGAGGGRAKRARGIGHDENRRRVDHSTPMFGRSRTWRQGLGISLGCAIVYR